MILEESKTGDLLEFISEFRSAAERYKLQMLEYHLPSSPPGSDANVIYKIVEQQL